MARWWPFGSRKQAVPEQKSSVSCENGGSAVDDGADACELPECIAANTNSLSDDSAQAADASTSPSQSNSNSGDTGPQGPTSAPSKEKIPMQRQRQRRINTSSASSSEEKGKTSNKEQAAPSKEKPIAPASKSNTPPAAPKSVPPNRRRDRRKLAGTVKKETPPVPAAVVKEEKPPEPMKAPEAPPKADPVAVEPAPIPHAPKQEVSTVLDSRAIANMQTEVNILRAMRIFNEQKQRGEAVDPKAVAETVAAGTGASEFEARLAGIEERLGALAKQAEAMAAFSKRFQLKGAQDSVFVLEAVPNQAGQPDHILIRVEKR